MSGSTRSVLLSETKTGATARFEGRIGRIPPRQRRARSLDEAWCRMSGEAPARDPYLVKSVVHASRLLSAFRSSGEALPLRDIASRSGLPKSMAFRLLYTLERCGMVDKVGENLYRCSPGAGGPSSLFSLPYRVSPAQSLSICR